MVIRDLQMAVFKTACLEQTVQRIIVHLKRFAPDTLQGLSEEEIRNRVRTGMRRAEGLGVESYGYTLAFVQTMFAVGPGFYRHPSVAAILSDLSLPPDARVKKLFVEPCPVDWEGVAAATDQRSWSE
jgi:hypothetical protein